MKKITLKFYINLRPLMSVTVLTVENKTLDQDSLDNMRSSNDSNKIDGEIIFDVASTLDTITIDIKGVGQPNESLTFNFKYNDKKLFTDDQTVVVKETGRFCFFISGINLPV